MSIDIETFLFLELESELSVLKTEKPDNLHYQAMYL